MAKIILKIRISDSPPGLSQRSSLVSLVTLFLSDPEFTAIAKEDV
jgi:hypothetical protein